MPKSTPTTQALQQAAVEVRDVKLEQAMLNRLINERYVPMQVLPLLTEACFTEQDHLTVFRAIVQLEQKGLSIDMLTVTDHLRRSLPEKDLQPLILRVCQTLFTEDIQVPADYLAQRLLEYAKRRNLRAAELLMERLRTDMSYDFKEGVSEVLRLIEVITMGSKESFITLVEAFDETQQILLDNQDDATRHIGLLTGFPQIDDTGGLPDNGLVVVGARTSHGKSTFATHLTMQALRQGKHVGFYSMEMSVQQIVSRLLAMQSGVNSNAIQRLKLSANDLQHVRQSIDELKASVAERLHFDNRSIHDIDALTLSIRSLQKSQGLDVAVVDYLQLMTAPAGRRFDTKEALLGDIAHTMHNLAQELHITIIALSQINRNATGEPTIDQLRDSGQIAEAADSIILLYNPAVNHQLFGHPFETVNPKGHLLIKSDKNRNNANCFFLADFDPVTSTIAPYTEAQGVEPTAKPVPTEEPLW